MRYYVLTISFCTLLTVTGCTGDSGGPFIHQEQKKPAKTPVDKAPKGEPVNVVTMFAGDANFAQNVKGKTTLVAKTEKRSLAPDRPAASRLPKSAWVIKETLAFGGRNQQIPLFIEFTSNEIKIASVCKFEAGGLIAGDRYISLPVVFDGNRVYVQHEFSIKTDDGNGNSCQIMVSGDYIQFIGDPTASHIGVKLGGVIFDAHQLTDEEKTK